MVVSKINWRVILQEVVLPVFIVLIGLLAIVGYKTDIPLLFELGMATAASPLPLPFTDYKLRQENFSYQYVLYITRSTGTEEIIARSSLLQSTHKQKVAFISSIIFSPRHNPLVMNALRYNFCIKELSEAGLDPENKVTSLIIDFRGPIEKSNQFVFISCSD
jgi:hypothetical protein